LELIAAEHQHSRTGFEEPWTILYPQTKLLTVLGHPSNSLNVHVSITSMATVV